MNLVFPRAMGKIVLLPVSSATSLDPNSIGGPEGPFGLVWLSLPHLISCSNSNSSGTPSYIIVQHPLNRPLNLWNRMFDRHQAEITVMQFTGHSLLVHHSEVGLHLVPYYQPSSPA